MHGIINNMAQCCYRPQRLTRLEAHAENSGMWICDITTRMCLIRLKKKRIHKKEWDILLRRNLSLQTVKKPQYRTEENISSFFLVASSEAILFCFLAFYFKLTSKQKHYYLKSMPIFCKLLYRHEIICSKKKTEFTSNPLQSLRCSLKRPSRIGHDLHDLYDLAS